MRLFYIILPTPRFVNARSSSLAFGPAVHFRMATILPVTTSDFPNWFDIQSDSFRFAAVRHNKEPVVVVVDNSVESGIDTDTVVATVVVAGSDSKSNRELRVILPCLYSLVKCFIVHDILIDVLCTSL